MNENILNSLGGKCSRRYSVTVSWANATLSDWYHRCHKLKVVLESITVLSLALRDMLGADSAKRGVLCTCLCFGFLLHITYTRPFLLTTLQPSHMRLTEERTFMPRERIGVAVECHGRVDGRCVRSTTKMLVRRKSVLLDRSHRESIVCRQVFVGPK